jgi:glycosyltransferase involved in cell wall biosynthesis
MTFLLYTETYPSTSPSTRYTGIGGYCRDLADGLVQAGHHVTVLTGREIDDDITTRGTLRIVRCGELRHGRWDLLDRARFVRAQVAETRPDAVLVGDALAHRVLSAGRWLMPFRVSPIFYGTELQGYAGLAKAGPTRVRSRLRWSAYRKYIERAECRICISEYARGLLNDMIPGRLDTIIVYPSVSTTYLTTPLPGPDAPRQGPLRVVTIGRISERKNQLQLLESLNQLRRTAGLTFHYTIIGNVDAAAHGDYRDRILRYIAAEGLHDHVRVMTNASDQEAIAELDRSDVFIMLSRAAGVSVEGFGIAVIEASVREKPVIVSDHGGLRETVDEGVTGFVVPDSDSNALQTALLTMARDPELRARMGKAGRARVLHKFTPAAMAGQLLGRFGPRLARSEAAR